jgi:hypothetical protein
MNVQSPPWASFFPKSREPLSSGLRSAYETHETLPPDIEKLLSRLGSNRRVAQQPRGY